MTLLQLLDVCLELFLYGAGFFEGFSTSRATSRDFLSSLFLSAADRPSFPVRYKSRGERADGRLALLSGGPGATSEGLRATSRLLASNPFKSRLAPSQDAPSSHRPFLDTSSKKTQHLR